MRGGADCGCLQTMELSTSLDEGAMLVEEELESLAILAIFNSPTSAVDVSLDG